VGWQNLIVADDPGFVDTPGSDFRLNPSTPGVGAAHGIYCGDGFVDEFGMPSVDYQYDFADGGGWVARPATTNLGAWESDPQKGDTPLPSSLSPAVAVPLVGPFSLPISGAASVTLA
jgi:hypothetical protein